MSSPGITITSRNAIVTSKHTLIVNSSKFFPPNNIIREYPSDDVLRMCYRRFMRLTPLISRRSMIRQTYVHYVRYKFKNENYEEKRLASGLAVLEAKPCILQQVVNSLNFCLEAVVYVKKGSPGEQAVAEEMRLSKNIIKNILAIEYEKAKLIAHNPQQNYPILRKTFKYMAPDAQKLGVLARFHALKEFDRCLIGLNEVIGTRL